MSTSRSKTKIPLRIHAHDRSTEIFVMDGKFRRIASGIGDLSRKVAPGFYKVRFRSGSEQKDRLIEVSPDETEVVIQGEAIDFASAAPIDDTSSTSEHHSQAAEDESRNLHLQKGYGGELFIFLRDLDPSPAVEPWTGVTLHKIDGELVSDFSEGVKDPTSHYAALNFALEPGTYKLRVESGFLGTVEMFLVVCRDWQTQAFVTSSEIRLGKKSVRRAELDGASVYMARLGRGFESSSEVTRLTELAMQGLVSGRNVVRRDDLQQILEDIFEDPMLGIYGAHLMLKKRNYDKELFEVVIVNLNRLLGNHQDVDALSLRLGPSNRSKQLSFPLPPMLRKSWELIVSHSVNRRNAVPPGSFAETMAATMATSNPWLIHHLYEQTHIGDITTSFAQAKRELQDLFSKGKEQRRAILQAVQDDDATYTPLEQRILSTMVQSEEIAELLSEGVRAAKANALQSAEKTEKSFIRQVNAPANAVEQSTKNLNLKLSRLKANLFDKL